MNITKDLMLERISKQECPICGKAIKDPVEINDEYIAKEPIKVCNTHNISLKHE